MHPTRPRGGGAVLRLVTADNRHRTDVLVRKTAEIVRESEARLILALAVTRAAEHLQIDFVDHAQARGADRVPEALEAAVDLARYAAGRIIEPVEHVIEGAALGRDVQVLHGDEFRHRAAVDRK